MGYQSLVNDYPEADVKQVLEDLGIEVGEGFEGETRRIQERIGRPYADDIYQEVFGEATQITRMEHDDNKVLDVNFAIDVQLRLPTDQILLGQEKFLSQKYATFRSVTVEYEQDHRTGEEGDWFKLAPQFYFVSYFNKTLTGFGLWVLLNWANIVLATLEGRIPWTLNRNRNNRARASFKYCHFDALPDECIISSSQERLL